MPNESTDSGTTPNPTDPPAGTTPTEPPAEQTPEGQAPAEENVPAEVLRKKLTDANAEAANYRTQLRSAQEQLKNAKTVEEFATATAELNGKIAELERGILVRDVASQFGLPAELAAVLQGATEDELKAHAEQLKKFVPAEEIDPATLNGGLDPSGDKDSDPEDPRALARKYAGRRRHR